jgi:hypothetical protein
MDRFPRADLGWLRQLALHGNVASAQPKLEIDGSHEWRYRVGWDAAVLMENVTQTRFVYISQRTQSGVAEKKIDLCAVAIQEQRGTASGKRLSLSLQNLSHDEVP